MSFEIVAPEPLATAQTAVVPFEVKTKLFAPIGKRVALLTPLPMIRSPVLVIGDKALNAAPAVVWPVPPLAIATVPVTLLAVPVVFWFRVGTSAATIARNVGTPAVPLGAAKKKLAVLLAYGFCVSPYPEAKLIAGVVPPDDTTGEVPVTDVTGAVPLDAAVIRPLPLTVIDAFVKLPTLALTVASVPAAVTLAEPSKLGLV